MKTVGRALKDRRRALVMTQVEVVNSTRRSDGTVAIAESTYRALESGRSDGISDRSVGAIARALSWPPDWYDRLLAGETPDETWDTRGAPVPAEIYDDPIGRIRRTQTIDTARQSVSRDYNSDINELPPEDQAVIDAMIDNFRRKQQS